MYFLSLEERKYQRKNRRPPAFFASNVSKATRYRRVRRRVNILSKQAKSVTAGDPELITVKGQRLLREAEVIIYAGSLVNPELLKICKENADWKGK